MSNNNKNGHCPMMRLTVLAMSLCAAQSSVYAMQALNEQDYVQSMLKMELCLILQYDRIDIDRLYWEDKVV
jgi:hypothetical protein